MDDIKPRLKNIYVQALRLEIAPTEIGDTALISTLGVDSIKALEILIWVEDEFKITIKDEDLTGDLIDSLDKLAEYIRSCQSATDS